MVHSKKHPLLRSILLGGLICLPFQSLAASVQYSYDDHHRLISASYDTDVTLSYAYDDADNRFSKHSSGPDAAIYEDAQDGTISGWDIYDSDPSGATITNVFDSQITSRVIEFSGAGTANGYRLRNDDGSNWNDSTYTTIQWSARFADYFNIYIAVQTTDGFRYLHYSPSATDNLGSEKFIHHGLGTAARNGQWQTFARDLAYDIQDAQPGNELVSVLAFLVKGDGRMDDIKTVPAIPATFDTDGDTLSDFDEINSYGSDPYSTDTDGDGIADGDELAYWGEAWNVDSDGDGLLNLLDPDADNDGYDDALEITGGTDPADAATFPTRRVYEDAEDTIISGWDVYDNDPTGAYIENVYDDTVASRVIQFSGDGTLNGYRLRNDDSSYWNDTTFSILEWSMQYSESFTVYIAVQTRDGFRYLTYTPKDTSSLGDEKFIHHGIGSHLTDGTWYTLVRDLEYDLKMAQPDNELEAVLGFLVRGSGKVDDIATLAEIPEEQDSDGDTLSDIDEFNVYTTDPYSADTDGDTIYDDEELSYWGTNWNSDPDSDGIINILDDDADNDGFSDGVEIQQGTGPANADSFPTSRVYEDGEDSTISGWDIYDNSPEGAAISNVFDDGRQSQVIELTGSAKANGYRLRNSDGSYWYDTNFSTLQWSMRFSEAFTVYVAVQSTDGFRYLQYTPAQTSNLGSDKYIHHGLGSSTIDGSWHTLSRDLQADLQQAQPDNQLESVLGFLIRGSGRVDDIKTTE